MQKYSKTLEINQKIGTSMNIFHFEIFRADLFSRKTSLRVILV